MARQRKITARNASEARGIRKALKAAGLKFRFARKLRFVSRKKRRRRKKNSRRQARAGKTKFRVSYLKDGRQKTLVVLAKTIGEAERRARKKIGPRAFISSLKF